MGRYVRRKVLRVRFCSVRGCPNYGRSFRKSADVNKIPIFNCPTPNSPILKKWLEALKMQEYDSRIHICIRHFEEDFIIREKTIVNHDGSTSTIPLRKPVVTKNAVPTIFDEMTTKLGPHCPLVRMWRGAPRKYADTSIQAMCSVTLQTEPRDGAGDCDREIAYDEMKLVKTPIFIKSEVPDPELGWLNEDPKNCKIQNTFVENINIENDVIIKQEIDIDDECQMLVENEAVVGTCKRKRKRIRGAPVGPQIKKPRAKELFYPCPICHLLIQRRRQMINHMQRRHPDDELTKRVLKEREVNPRGHYRSLTPYLSLAIKTPDGFHDYSSKNEDESHCPPASDSSHPPSPSLSPTPSDCEDPLAGRPASTEPPTSPPVSLSILPEPFFDDEPSATTVPGTSATSTSPPVSTCILPEPYFDDEPSATPVPRTSATSTSTPVSTCILPEPFFDDESSAIPVPGMSATPTSPPVSTCILPEPFFDDETSATPTSPPVSTCILPEPFFDNETSATHVPGTSATSTSPSTVSEPCNSKSKCRFPLPSVPPLVPIYLPSNPTSNPYSCDSPSTSDSTQNVNEASPLSDDILSPRPSSDQEDTAISSSVIYSSWDLSVFKVHLYNIPKEKKIFLKKRLMEVVEAVTIRNLDPESIIIAYCDRNKIKS